MSTAPLPRRPGSVTLVATLTWIAAALDLIAGAAMVWLSYNPDLLDDALSVGDVRWYGYASLVVGALTAAVAIGLAGGSQGARILVVLLMTLRIAAAAYAFIQVGDFSVWQAGVQVALALIIIAMLSTRRASDFFRGRAR